MPASIGASTGEEQAPPTGAGRRRIMATNDMLPIEEPVTESEPEPKVRLCLMCRKPFESEWAGERICRKCKSTQAWRQG